MADDGASGSPDPPRAGPVATEAPAGGPAPPVRPRRTARRLGGTFLGSAKSRLLPASVPFRFFGAAVGFHVAAWMALAVGADDFVQHAGGPGWVLAALHLITLGVLATTAVGAALQLLPVATRQPVRWPRAAAALWWVLVPGIALLTLGMAAVRVPWMLAGAAAVLPALALAGVLLALNLRGARGMPGVVLHGWGALLALAVLLATAVLLLAGWTGRAWTDRGTAHAWHVLAGPFGFMGLLALGLAYILVPMFALSDTPAERRQLASGGAALAALGLAGTAAALAGSDGLRATLRAAAWLSAAVAVGLHLHEMRRALAGGMRRELGGSFVLVRSGWAALGATLLLAAVVLAFPGAGVATRLLGLLAIGGWLLGFLLGMLQRILPFLASMHAAPGRRRAPTPSAFSDERALALHRHAHGLALLLLVAAVPLHSPGLARAGALVGLVGALAYAVFFAALMRRWTRVAADPAG